MADITLRQAFSNIAGAIRAKGVTGTMTPLEMPTKIAAIPSGGGSTKYGMTIDNLVGDVDSSGQLQFPSTPFSFSSTEIKSLVSYALYYRFYNNTGLTSVNLPNLTSCGTNGLYTTFSGCTNLTSVNLPKLASGTLGNTFSECTSLTSVELPEFHGALSYTFLGCTALEVVDFHETTQIPRLANTGTFSGTNATYKIVVPDALYNDWIAASNWSNENIVGHIVKASEYTPAS